MHYEIKHWAWNVPKEDGSTSQVLGSALQIFPFASWNLEDRQPKLKVSVMSMVHGSHLANTSKSNEQDHGASNGSCVGTVIGRAGPEEERQIKGDSSVLGVCE